MERKCFSTSYMLCLSLTWLAFVGKKIKKITHVCSTWEQKPWIGLARGNGWKICPKFTKIVYFCVVYKFSTKLRLTCVQKKITTYILYIWIYEYFTHVCSTYTQGRMLRKLQVKKTDSQLRIPIQNFQNASDRGVLPYWKFEKTKKIPLLILKVILKVWENWEK